MESDWIAALAQIAELTHRHRDGEAGGHAIDVLNLSMGYYHETPEDQLFDPTLLRLLEDSRQVRHVVVCSAGNDATAASFPAAFAPWTDGNGPVSPTPTVVPDRVRRRAQPQPQAPTPCSATPGPGSPPTSRAPRS